MTFQIRVVTIADNGQQQVHDITSVQRTELKLKRRTRSDTVPNLVLCEI